LKSTTYYALIIGINQYSDPGIINLDDPVSDATKLADVLNEKYTFNQENIILLENPDRNEILDNLDELKNKIIDEDNLLVFYAGHGMYDEEFEQGYWLPSDAQKDKKSAWLSNSTIVEYLRGINSKHTLLIADACFSGGIFKSRSIEDIGGRLALEKYKMSSRKAITSGALNTVPDESVFMEYLLKRLDQNDLELFAAEQLYLSFREAVLVNSPLNSRAPLYGVIHNANDEGGGGDFLFLIRQ